MKAATAAAYAATFTSTSKRMPQASTLRLDRETAANLHGWSKFIKDDASDVDRQRLHDWRTQPRNYYGQCSRERKAETVRELTRLGWTADLRDGHFVQVSPNKLFMVRYVAVGKTKVRSYFERNLQ